MDGFQSDNASGLDQSQLGQMQEFVREENRRAEIQNFVVRLTDICYERCIKDPGRSLSGEEKKCMSL